MKKGNNGLPCAFPNFIVTSRVTLQVPGLTFSQLCLARGRVAAPGKAGSGTTRHLGCFRLGSTKLTFVLVIYPHLSQTSFSSFLNESKHLLTKNKPSTMIQLCARFPLESYRTSLEISYSMTSMFITHKSFTSLGFHVL